KGGASRAAMGDQQPRVGPVLAADAHELPDAADGQILVTLDAGRRNDPAQLADDADGVLARRGLLLLCGSGEDSDQYGDGNSKKPEGPHTPGPRGGREGSTVPLYRGMEARPDAGSTRCSPGKRSAPGARGGGVTDVPQARLALGGLRLPRPRQQRMQQDRAERRGADAAQRELAELQRELAGTQDQGDGGDDQVPRVLDVHLDIDPGVGPGNCDHAATLDP